MCLSARAQKGPLFQTYDDDFANPLSAEPIRGMLWPMARRRTAARTTGPGSDIVVVNAGPPARRRSGGGGRRRRSRSRRRSSRGGGGESYQTRLQSVAIGGAAYGMLIKNYPELPRLGGLGRSGTVALACYFLKPSQGVLRDMGIAAAAIAGYSFGKEGTVEGDDDVILAD